MELHIITAENIDKYREELSFYIESFVERSKGRYAIEDVFNNIKSGYWVLWVVHEHSELKAVLITQTIEYPRLKELQIIMCVGENHKDWYSLISKMEEYAKLMGCTKITAITRPGWEKVMKGYKKSHVYLERNL